MFHKDFLVRQLQHMTEAIGSMVFNKETAAKYEALSEVNLNQPETDLLYVLLCDRIANNSVNEAENLLFDSLDGEDRQYTLSDIEVAADFYAELNRWSDEELEASDFSREEVLEGLNDILNLLGVSLPSDM